MPNANTKDARTHATIIIPRRGVHLDNSGHGSAVTDRVMFHHGDTVIALLWTDNDAGLALESRANPASNWQHRLTVTAPVMFHFYSLENASSQHEPVEVTVVNGNAQRIIGVIQPYSGVGSLIEGSYEVGDLSTRTLPSPPLPRITVPGSLFVSLFAFVQAEVASVVVQRVRIRHEVGGPEEPAVVLADVPAQPRSSIAISPRWTDTRFVILPLLFEPGDKTETIEGITQEIIDWRMAVQGNRHYLMSAAERNQSIKQLNDLGRRIKQAQVEQHRNRG